MQDTFSPLGLPDMARRALPALPSFLGGSGMIRSPLGKSFLYELGPCVSNRLWFSLLLFLRTDSDSCSYLGPAF